MKQEGNTQTQFLLCSQQEIHMPLEAPTHHSLLPDTPPPNFWINPKRCHCLTHEPPDEISTP